MKTHDQIIEHLATELPFVSIETIFESDADAVWDVESDDLDEDDFEAWNTEIKATAIHNGKLLQGSGYLGGTWTKYGDYPDASIGGYFPQMCQEALRELAKNMADAGAAESAVIMVRGCATWCCNGEEVGA